MVVVCARLEPPSGRGVGGWVGVRVLPDITSASAIYSHQLVSGMCALRARTPPSGCARVIFNPAGWVAPSVAACRE